MRIVYKGLCVDRLGERNHQRCNAMYVMFVYRGTYTSRRV